MTKLLEKAVAAISALPDDQQDEAAFILLQFAGIEPPFALSAEDETELEASLAEEARGEFATDEDVRAMWAKGAQNVRVGLQAAIDRLGDHPYSGQATGKGDIRRAVANPYPYLNSVASPLRA